MADKLDITLLQLQSSQRDEEYFDLFNKAVEYSKDFSDDAVTLDQKKVLLAKKKFCIDKLNTLVHREGSQLQTIKGMLNDYPSLKTWHTKRVALISDYTERIKSILDSERDLSWTLYNVLKY